MTILLHDYHELEERAAKHLKVWKGWHVTLFILTGVFGLLNYTFFQYTANIFDDNCVLFPRKLEFRLIELPDVTLISNNENENINSKNYVINDENEVKNATDNIKTEEGMNITEDDARRRKRESTNNEKNMFIPNNTDVNNSTTYNKKNRLVLNMQRSLFAAETDCQFAMFMPVLSTVFAFVWATLFTMCPGGGYSRFGLSQPWRILTPALLFAIVMVGLTGHSFSQTNAGLQALCASFSSVTNTTACSAVNDHVEKAWNASWTIGTHVSAARAASAGVWATWACACALLLARCLAAPDFVVKHTQIIIKTDPKQKVTPYLKQSPKKSPNMKNTRIISPQQSPSLMSEPTISSALMTSPVIKNHDHQYPSNNHELRNEMLELVYIPPTDNDKLDS